MATSRRPRLRSMRNSGCAAAGCRPDDRFDGIWGHSELAGDGEVALAGPESVEDVFHSNLLALQDGLPEREPRVDDDIGALVCLETQAQWIAILCPPFDELQVLINHAGDSPLPV